MSEGSAEQHSDLATNDTGPPPAPAAQEWRVLWILTATTLASPMILAAVSVALYMTGSLASTRIGGPEGLGDMRPSLGMLFWVLALIFIAVSLFVGVRPGGTTHRHSSRSQLFAHYKAMGLVRMALAEVPGILGLVALILRNDLGQALYLQGAALATMLFAWPRRESFESLCHAMGLSEPDVS